jgi:hypothetical protein
MAAPDELGPLVDQWGLELAKALAKQAIPELHSQQEPALRQNSSTRPLIRRYRQFRRR